MITLENIIEVISDEDFIRLYFADTDELLYEGRLEDLNFGIWRNLKDKNVYEIYPVNNDKEPILPYLCIFIEK